MPGRRRWCAWAAVRLFEPHFGGATVLIGAAKAAARLARLGDGARDVPARALVGAGAGDALDARAVAQLALGRAATGVGGALLGLAAAIGALIGEIGRAHV